MKQFFISVPVKLLLLVVGALLISSASFSILSLTRLNEEFKQYQMSTLELGKAQFDNQNAALRQQLGGWLESFADLVQLKEQPDFDVLALALSAQFEALQLNYNVENVWLLSGESTMLYQSKNPPEHVTNSVQRVFENQSPEHLLHCDINCRQLITVPFLNKQGHMAVVAMSVSLVDMVFAIHQAMQNDVAILGFKKATDIKIAQANFISTSDQVLVDKLFLQNNNSISIEEIKKQGLQVELGDKHYLINLMPLAASAEQDYYFALIDDVTMLNQKYYDYRQQFFTSMLVIFIALAFLVNLAAGPFTRRLLVLSNVLPLLAKKEFEQFRAAKIKRKGTFVDELDILADATTELSYELEQLNIEIDQKTKELENIAMFDLLTGLPNRNMLNYQLRKAIGNLACSSDNPTCISGKLAVLFLDLDDFKKVNDSNGHGYGDKLLIEAASRLRLSIPTFDIVCRFGGDEFVIVLNNLDLVTDAEEVAEKILAQFRAPIKIDSSVFYVSTSIGIAFTDDPKIKAEQLVSFADIAMYEAKNNGGAQYHLYHPDMHQRIAHLVMLEGEVRQALAKNQFSLSLQPQIKAKSKKVYGFEALLRWQHPERGMVSPEDFIPILENSEHMIELGYWIFRRCFDLSAQFKARGFHDAHISINLSAGQFADPNLPEYLQGLLQEFNLSANSFELELTEQTLVKDMDRTIDMMNNLKAIGFSFSIDDFGTGYSSLAYLKKMPVDVIKIDKSFIFGMLENHADHQIIMSTIAMVKNLDLLVVAEGVETSAQLRCLAENDCDIIQGYYFSKPIPEAELFDFLNNKMFNGYWKTSVIPISGY